MFDWCNELITFYHKNAKLPFLMSLMSLIYSALNTEVLKKITNYRFLCGKLNCAINPVILKPHYLKLFFVSPVEFELLGSTVFPFFFYLFLSSKINIRYNLRANAQKNRAKSPNRGHSSKPNPPSSSVYNKVLMSL